MQCYSPPSYGVDTRLPLSTKKNLSTYPRWLIRDTLCLISLVTRPLQPRQLLKQPSSWMQRLSKNPSQTCVLESPVSSLEASEKASPASCPCQVYFPPARANLVGQPHRRRNRPPPLSSLRLMPVIVLHPRLQLSSSCIRT